MEDFEYLWKTKINEIITNCWISTPNNKDTSRLLKKFSNEQIKEKISDCFEGISNVKRVLATIWDIHQYNKHKTINERVIKYILEYDVNLNITESGLDVLNIRVNLDNLPIKELFNFLGQIREFETYFVVMEKDGEWYFIED